jgi:histidinol-phosphate phosphatase family protein
MDDRQLPRAIIFDRDGTLTKSLEPVISPQDIELLSGAAQAIRACNEANIPVGLASNQGIVARGLLSTQGLDLVHQRFVDLLQGEGAFIDGFRYCPHHPAAANPVDRTCKCRKPGPQMLQDLASEFGVDAEATVMIGDNSTDLGAAKSAGMMSVLVLTGHGESFKTDPLVSAIAMTALDAVIQLGLKAV